MRVFGKWLGRVLLALVLLGALVWVWKREEIDRLIAVNRLFAEDRIVGNFSAMGTMFLTRPLDIGTAEPSPLPPGAPLALPAGYDGWVKERAGMSGSNFTQTVLVLESYWYARSI